MPSVLRPLREVMRERREVLAPSEQGKLPIVQRISFDGQIHLRESRASSTKLIVIHPGDIVFSGINAVRGAISRYRQDDGQHICATIHYSAYVVDGDAAHPEYLCWFFRTRVFRQLLVDQVPSSIKSEIRASRLLEVRVPIPDLPQQEAMIRYLADVERSSAQVVEDARGAASRAGAITQAIIDQVMGRFRRFTTLAEYLEVKPRSGPSFPTHPDWGGATVLMPSAVTGFGVDLAKVERGLGDEVVSDKDRLRAGDVVIARGNKREQVGNAGVVPPEAEGWVCANLLMRMRPTPGVSAEFMVYWLRTTKLRAEVMAAMGGTSPSIQKINQRAILAFSFPEGLSFREQESIVVQLKQAEGSSTALAEHCAHQEACASRLLLTVLEDEFREVLRRTG